MFLLKYLLVVLALGHLVNAFDERGAPRNVHIALTNSIHQMTVSWWTKEPTESPVINYGTSPGNYSHSVVPTVTTYNATLAGYCYHALLNSLVPDTEYFYMISVEYQDAVLSSYEFSFMSAPDKSRPHTILTYGDMGVRESEETIRRVLELVQQDNVDLIYHVGDISYADDQDCSVYEYVWTEFLDLVESAAAQIPYMTCPGNHEYGCADSQIDNYKYTKNFTAYNTRFSMPSVSSNGTKNMWFSFNYGNIHFISLDTETDYPGAPEGSHMFGDQLDWLAKDLAAVDRSRYPWIIATGHRPMYSSAPGFSDDRSGVIVGDPVKLMDAMEALFNKYDVDLFIVGHVHAYERMYPVYNGTVTSKSYDKPTSTVHIVNGAGGNQESHITYSSNFPVAQDWLAHRYSGWGFGLISILNDETLEWKFYRADDGGLEDSFTITK